MLSVRVGSPEDHHLDVARQGWYRHVILRGGAFINDAQQPVSPCNQESQPIVCGITFIPMQVHVIAKRIPITAPSSTHGS